LRAQRPAQLTKRAPCPFVHTGEKVNQNDPKPAVADPGGQQLGPFFCGFEKKHGCRLETCHRAFSVTGADGATVNRTAAKRRNHEVGLLNAASEGALRKTRGRYFEDIEDLLAAVASF
jgi:hypothetical protein